MDQSSFLDRRQYCHVRSRRSRTKATHLWPALQSVAPARTDAIAEFPRPPSLQVPAELSGIGSRRGISGERTSTIHAYRQTSRRTHGAGRSDVVVRIFSSP